MVFSKHLFRISATVRSCLNVLYYNILGKGRAEQEAPPERLP